MSSNQPELHSDILMRPLNSLREDLSLLGFFTYYVTSLRDEIPSLIKDKDLIGLDYMIEMNGILLKDAGISNMTLHKGYLCDIVDAVEKDAVLEGLDYLAEAAKQAWHLDNYKKPALRTLRDTFYRLVEDGHLRKERQRVNKEILFTPEELLKILLEKRMANKRIRKEREIIFNLPQEDLKKLMCVHPKHFKDEIEEKIKGQEKAKKEAPITETPKTVKVVSAIRSTEPELIPRKEIIADEELITSTYKLCKKEPEITLSLPPMVIPTPAIAEEILENTAKALGIKLEDSEKLLIKALAVKVGK